MAGLEPTEVKEVKLLIFGVTEIVPLNDEAVGESEQESCQSAPFEESAGISGITMWERITQPLPVRSTLRQYQVGSFTHWLGRRVEVVRLRSTVINSAKESQENMILNLP